MLNREWEFIYANKKTGEVTGHDPSFLIGKKVWDLFPEALTSVFYEPLRKAMEERQPSSCSGFYGPLNLWIELLAYPAQDGVSVFVRDISSIKNSEEKIISANRFYQFISQVNQAIIRATDEETLFKTVCKAAISIGGFQMAWVGLLNKETKELKPVIFEGLDTDYLLSIKIVTDKDKPEGRGPSGTSIREGRTIYCNDIETDPKMEPWREDALKRGYYSSISIPIHRFEEVIGAFVLYASTRNFFNEEEITVLEEVTNDISFTLEMFAKEELRKQTETLLQKRTIELNERVKELNCLYNISDTCNIYTLSIDDILTRSVKTLTGAYQYPEIACARITFSESVFQTDHFAVSPWKQEAEIIITGKSSGKIEVFYMEEKPEESEGPFLKEERWLINSVATILSTAIERKKRGRELLETNEQLRQLSEHLQNVREDERTKVAREIHDELGQQLAIIKMEVSRLQKKIKKDDDPALKRAEELKKLLDETVNTVRRISSSLRPSMLDDMGLEAAIDWYLAEFCRRSGINTLFKKMNKELNLPDNIKTGLFRILQESLTNVIKYAEAKNVNVYLGLENAELVLVINDDGVGFDLQMVRHKKTLGLLGMRERAAMLGGSYEIMSEPGKGTTTIVKVPLTEKDGV